MNALHAHIIEHTEQYLQQRQAQRPCVRSGAAYASEDG